MPVCEDEPTMPELQKQAFDWLVQLRAEQLTESEIHAFADWISLDPRHSEAFAAAEDLLSDMIVAAGGTLRHFASSTEMNGFTKISEIQLKSAQGIRSKKSRLRWLAIPIAMAASWLFAVILVMPPQSHSLASFLSDYHTGTGEFLEITLSDGSSLLLNTNSAVSVNFSNDDRQIKLHHGQVRFTVAKDRQRPFEVNSGDLTLRALGTVFEVSSIKPNESTVIVQEHAVSARIGSEENSEPPIKVEEGQRLRYQKGLALQEPETVELEQVTAWQHHQLVLNDRPLSELINELNRYRNGRIFLSDSNLQTQRISGVFSLDHPDNTLQTLQTALDLKQTRLGAWWVVLHR